MFSFYALTAIPSRIFHLHTPLTTAKIDWCLHPDASCILVGTKKFATYKLYIKLNIIANPSTHYFCFGIAINRRNGSFMACPPIPSNSFLTLKTNIIPIDVPFLIVMDVLQQCDLNNDFYTQHLTSRSHNWSLSLNFKHSHVFILHDQIPFYTCNTKQELLKLHKYFMHPPPRKLFPLIKHTKPEKSRPKILKLQLISAVCEACAQYNVPFFGSGPPFSNMNLSSIWNFPWI